MNFKPNPFTIIMAFAYVIKCTYDAAFVIPFWFLFEFENTPNGRVAHLFFVLLLAISAYLSFKKFKEEDNNTIRWVGVFISLLVCVILKFHCY